MMYKSILTSNYDKLKVDYAGKASISSLRKIVSLRGSDVSDSYSDNSDILIYFDAIDGRQVLVLVERIPEQEFETEEQLDEIIKKINKELDGYTISYSLSEIGDFVDFTVVLNSVQEAIS